MKNKLFLFSALAFVISIYQVNAQTQTQALTIKKIDTGNPDNPLYIASYPMNLVQSDEKSIMLTIRFTTNRQTGKLSDIMGLQLFATGVGKCFQHDTLQLKFADGKTMKIASTSPMFCDQKLAGWFELDKETLAALFVSPLRQVNFVNKISGEIFDYDVTATEQQTYLIDLKKMFDTMISQ
jgi:hypothetical protein